MQRDMFCSVLFCSVLFCSVLFCSVLFCSVLFKITVSFLNLYIRNFKAYSLCECIGNVPFFV